MFSLPPNVSAFQAACRAFLEECKCPLCAKPWRKASTFPCGHTFCYDCAISTLEGPGISQSECPTCKGKYWKRDLRPNPQLMAVVENTQKILGLQGARSADSSGQDPADGAAALTAKDAGLACTCDGLAAIGVEAEGRRASPEGGGFASQAAYSDVGPREQQPLQVRGVPSGERRDPGRQEQWAVEVGLVDPGTGLCGGAVLTPHGAGQSAPMHGADGRAPCHRNGAGGGEETDCPAPPNGAAPGGTTTAGARLWAPLPPARSGPGLFVAQTLPQRDGRGVASVQDTGCPTAKSSAGDGTGASGKQAQQRPSEGPSKQVQERPSEGPSEGPSKQVQEGPSERPSEGLPEARSQRPPHGAGGPSPGLGPDPLREVDANQLRALRCDAIRRPPAKHVGPSSNAAAAPTAGDAAGARVAVSSAEQRRRLSLSLTPGGPGLAALEANGARTRLCTPFDGAPGDTAFAFPARGGGGSSADPDHGDRCVREPVTAVADPHRQQPSAVQGPSPHQGACHAADAAAGAAAGATPCGGSARLPGFTQFHINMTAATPHTQLLPSPPSEPAYIWTLPASKGGPNAGGTAHGNPRTGSVVSIRRGTPSVNNAYLDFHALLEEAVDCMARQPIDPWPNPDAASDPDPERPAATAAAGADLVYGDWVAFDEAAWLGRLAGLPGPTEQECEALTFEVNVVDMFLEELEQHIAGARSRRAAGGDAAGVAGAAGAAAAAEVPVAASGGGTGAGGGSVGSPEVGLPDAAAYADDRNNGLQTTESASMGSGPGPGGLAVHRAAETLAERAPKHADSVRVSRLSPSGQPVGVGGELSKPLALGGDGDRHGLGACAVAVPGRAAMARVGPGRGNAGQAPGLMAGLGMTITGGVVDPAGLDCCSLRPPAHEASLAAAAAVTPPPSPPPPPPAVRTTAAAVWVQPAGGGGQRRGMEDSGAKDPAQSDTVGEPPQAQETALCGADVPGAPLARGDQDDAQQPLDDQDDAQQPLDDQDDAQQPLDDQDDAQQPLDDQDGQARRKRARTDDGGGRANIIMCPTVPVAAAAAATAALPGAARPRFSEACDSPGRGAGACGGHVGPSGALGHRPPTEQDTARQALKEGAAAAAAVVAPQDVRGVGGGSAGDGPAHQGDNPESAVNHGFGAPCVASVFGKRLPACLSTKGRTPIERRAVDEPQAAPMPNTREASQAPPRRRRGRDGSPAPRAAPDPPPSPSAAPTTQRQQRQPSRASRATHAEAHGGAPTSQRAGARRARAREGRQPAAPANEDTQFAVPVPVAATAAATTAAAGAVEAAAVGGAARRSKPLCVLSTGLSAPERNKLKELARRMRGVDLLEDATPSMTHLVVNLTPEGRAASRTVKYLRAVMQGCWVVGVKWVEACLEAGQLVFEGPFEAMGDTHHEGTPAMSRLRLERGEPPLFSGVNFCVTYIKDQTDGKVYRADVEALLQTAGGAIVRRPTLRPAAGPASVAAAIFGLGAITDPYSDGDGAHQRPERRSPGASAAGLQLPSDLPAVVVLLSAHSSADAARVVREWGCAPVLSSWVYDSISHYRVLPVEPYFVAPESQASTTESSM